MQLHFFKQAAQLKLRVCWPQLFNGPVPLQEVKARMDVDRALAADDPPGPITAAGMLELLTSWHASNSVGLSA